MRIAVISLTENGNRISDKISEKLDCERYSFKKYPSENSVIFESLSEITGDIFNKYDGIIFICAVGIAVRCIAPHIKSKQCDPAVISIDENGKFIYLTDLRKYRVGDKQLTIQEGAAKSDSETTLDEYRKLVSTNY